MNRKEKDDKSLSKTPLESTFSIISHHHQTTVGGGAATEAKPAARKTAKSVYFQLPSKLTEEELMLQSKYQKLKKKKKILAKQRAAPPRPEPKSAPAAKRPTSPQIGAKDAREIAKKLVRSGAIKIERTPTPSSEGFKRSFALERKLNTIEKSVGYQPFSATIIEGYGDSAGKMYNRKNRHEPAVTAGGSSDGVRPKTDDNRIDDDDDDDGGDEEVAATAGAAGTRSSSRRDEKPDAVSKAAPKKHGPTLYVSGQNLSEHLIRDLFNGYGKIINLIMVQNRKQAFVTLDDEEASHRAIKQLHNTTFKDVRIEITLARRKLLFDNHRWPGLPSDSEKRSETDQRTIVSYEDI